MQITTQNVRRWARGLHLEVRQTYDDGQSEKLMSLRENLHDWAHRCPMCKGYFTDRQDVEQYDDRGDCTLECCEACIEDALYDPAREHGTW